jgi:hypothetical protein
VGDSFPDQVHRSIERAGADRARPGAWPADFPIPPGSVLVATDKTGNGGIVLRGDGESNVEQWLTALRARGYRVGDTVDAKAEEGGGSSLRFHVRFPVARDDFAAEVHVWEPAGTGLAEAAVELALRGRPRRRPRGFAPGVPVRDYMWLGLAFAFAVGSIGAGVRARSNGWPFVVGVLVLAGYLTVLVLVGLVIHLVTRR